MIENVITPQTFQILHCTNWRGVPGPAIKRNIFQFSPNFDAVYRDDRKKTEKITDIKIGRLKTAPLKLTL